MPQRGLAAVLLVGALAVGMVAATSSPAFVGHHWTKSTCRYFTSAYHTARYFYDRRTCDQWKGLSNKYLRCFNSEARAQASLEPHAAPALLAARRWRPIGHRSTR